MVSDWETGLNIVLLLLVVIVHLLTLPVLVKKLRRTENVLAASFRLTADVKEDLQRVQHELSSIASSAASAPRSVDPESPIGVILDPEPSASV